MYTQFLFVTTSYYLFSTLYCTYGLKKSIYTASCILYRGKMQYVLLSARGRLQQAYKIRLGHYVCFSVLDERAH